MKKCPLCGAETAPLPGGLLDCGACGLVFRLDGYTGALVYAPGLEEEIYGAAKEKYFSSLLDFLEGVRPGKGRLLDIGCAVGTLLKAAAARGWKAEGVETAPALAAVAAGLGFAVSAAPVEEAGLARGGFEAIVLSEVFSQMKDPAAAAAEVYALLAPGGAVYIREFNASFHLSLASLERRGVFKPLGAAPCVLHDYNFRARTLRGMLARAGFTEIEVSNSRPTSGDPYRTGGRLGGVLTSALKVLYYWLAQACWFLSLGRVCAGSALTATARKAAEAGEKP